jgi:hypothetical protein
MVELLEANVLEEPASNDNVKLWFRAYRQSRHQDIDVAIDKLSIWRANGDSVEANYYLYVLHALKAINGVESEVPKAEDLIRISQEKARGLRNRTNSFEWLGRGKGLARLVHYSDLGDWDERSDFYLNSELLARVEGRVSAINRPEKGAVELGSTGLTVFFVPGKGGFYKGRDENRKVEFFLGFSYDGLRAWDVRAKE